MAAKSAVSATLVSYASYGIGIVSTALLIPFQIRLLGNDQFALWSLTFSSLSLLSLLEGGLSTAWMRFASGHPNRTQLQTGLGTMLRIYLSLVMVGMVLLAGLTLVYPTWTGAPAGLAVPLLWILGARVFYATLPLSLFRVLLHGQHYTVEAQSWATLHQLVYASLSLLWLWHGGDLLGLAWINLMVALSEHLGYLWLARRKIPGLNLWPAASDPELRREFQRQALAGAVVQMASLVLLKTDPLLVKAVLPIQAVALYAVALKVAENYLMFLKQFLPVLTPRLGAAAARDDLPELRRLIVQSSCWATLPAVALGLPFWVGAEGLLVNWVSPEYASAAPALKILLLSGLLSVPQMVFSSALAMAGQLSVNARAALLAAIINPLASLLWARVVGLPGIALGTLTATLIVDLMLIIRVGCTFFQVGALGWFWAMLRLHLPGLVLVTPLLWWLRAPASQSLWTWCAWAGLGAISYGLCVVLGLPAGEREALRSLRRRKEG